MAKRPVSGSKKPKRKLRRVDPARALSPEEVGKLKAWATWIIAKALAEGLSEEMALVVRNAVIMIVLLGTAARRFELCAFRCGDFSMGSGGEPVAHFDEAKGNTVAEVTITHETWSVVQAWLTHKKRLGESTAQDAPLFCGRGGEFLSRAQLNNIFDSVLQQAGLVKRKDVGVHSTRHAAGMLFLQATQSMTMTAEFLRHRSSRVTEDFYKHVLPSDVAAGLKKAGL